jgi:hypothetical protein
MKKDESDKDSVSSGSCTCSDYENDYEWFYDSRKLKTSCMRFFIKSDFFIKNNNIKKDSPKKGKDSTKSTNSFNDKREIKTKQIYLNTNFKNLKQNSKRKNIIKLKRRSPLENNDLIKNMNLNHSKLNTNNSNYIINHRRRNNESMDLTFKNNEELKSLNKTYIAKPIPINSYNSKNLIGINRSTRVNLFPHNLKEYKFKNKFKFTSPMESLIIPNTSFSKKIGSLNTTTKNKDSIFKDKVIKVEKRPILQKINIDKAKAFFSPRRNNYNSLLNLTCFSDDRRVKKNIKNISNNNSTIIKPNFQTKGSAIKEKIVNETKNIILEPGQTFKPKIVSKRRLKPMINIVKNEDGTTNIITEKTTLTTITVNEIINSSKLSQDKSPSDIQKVRQHITKIYKTESITKPFSQKK